MYKQEHEYTKDRRWLFKTTTSESEDLRKWGIIKHKTTRLIQPSILYRIVKYTSVIYNHIRRWLKRAKLQYNHPLQPRCIRNERDWEDLTYSTITEEFRDKELNNKELPW